MDVSQFRMGGEWSGRELKLADNPGRALKYTLILSRRPDCRRTCLPSRCAGALHADTSWSLSSNNQVSTIFGQAPILRHLVVDASVSFTKAPAALVNRQFSTHYDSCVTDTSGMLDVRGAFRRRHQSVQPWRRHPQQQTLSQPVLNSFNRGCGGGQWCKGVSGPRVRDQMRSSRRS